MKKHLLINIILLCVVAEGFANFDPSPKWTSLFNGKDLQGWRQLNGQARYVVENETIVGTTVAGEPNSFLATQNEYDNFILELEFQVDPSMNSGIQFRSESKPEYMNGRVHGYQYEIDPSPRAWTGGIFDESRRNWLYPMEYNPAAKNAFRQNQWNKVRIECFGNVIQTFLNGVPAATLVDDVTPKGFIALQVHAIPAGDAPGKQIRWRNIRIQTSPIQPSAFAGAFVVNTIPNSLSDMERSNGVKLLWDGKTTTGWRGAYKNSFPEKGWDIREGTLNVMKATGEESENGGDIVTVDEYSAFDLQFEFKFTDGANSGVKYFITESEGNKGSAIGLEYQILDDEKHPDAKLGVVGNRTLASLYDLIPSTKDPRSIHKVGTWNYGRIVVYPDGRVEHWLNGYKVVEYNRQSAIFDALVARSKYAQWSGFGKAKQGHILIQDHGDAVSFRSIKIKSLTSESSK